MICLFLPITNNNNNNNNSKNNNKKSNIYDDDDINSGITRDNFYVLSSFLLLVKERTEIETTTKNGERKPYETQKKKAKH